MMSLRRFVALAGTGLALVICPPLPAADDLEWLEPDFGEEALDWARAATQGSRAALTSEPGYEAIVLELGEAVRGHRPPQAYTLLGERAVRVLRDASHPRGLLQVASRGEGGLPGEWQTVLDIGAYGDAMNAQLTLDWAYTSSCLPPEYSRCLLAFSDGGADERALREFDLEAGSFVEDGFELGAARVQAAWIDADTVLVAHSLGDSAITAAGWSASARLWYRGGDPLEAPVVLTGEPDDATLQLLRYGAYPQVLATRVIDYSTFEVFTVDGEGRVAQVPVPRAVKAFGPLGGTTSHVVFQLSEPARINGEDVPAESVIAFGLDPHAPGAGQLEVVHIPEEDAVIDSFGGFASTRDEVFFPVRASLQTQIRAVRRGADGWTVRTVAQAEPGVEVSVVAADPAGDQVVLRRAGFLLPPTLSIPGPDGEDIQIEQAEPAFDASGYIAEVRSAFAPDGERIDFYLVRPENPDGPVPVLMTSYGAFGISFAPNYFGGGMGGPAMRLWFERGGALAVPAIRGGGERGVAWHRAAMRERRQVSYDDFIAVAENLVASGLTTPDMLGVFGTSNGGLLSAVVSVQRPDLFGAAVSDAPLADMLRYHQIAMGAAWMDEYGDPRVPEMREALLGYSPVQAIRPDGRYPPFLVTVSTTDNRVGPAHARKLAFRLQAAGGEVFFIENEQGGHGVSDPLARPDIMAMRMHFLISRLMPQAGE